jgi:hypothetical protein
LPYTACQRARHCEHSRALRLVPLGEFRRVSGTDLREASAVGLHPSGRGTGHVRLPAVWAAPPPQLDRRRARSRPRCSSANLTRSGNASSVRGPAGTDARFGWPLWAALLASLECDARAGPHAAARVTADEHDAPDVAPGPSCDPRTCALDFRWDVTCSCPTAAGAGGPIGTCLYPHSRVRRQGEFWGDNSAGHRERHLDGAPCRVAVDHRCHLVRCLRDRPVR